ncbi:hypothetical protein [Actinomadura madurae]|uniref:hypothetical protein n=1 Tax=Actinomadura madurae TaxID=1993 RepID=UPI0020D23CFB|nr:hypothetical protein [Actinomadura madurae]MCP9983218.1 hypothetical protein [Actinomadura madurae]
MTVTHEEKVVREFSKQAAGFADPELNVAFTRHLDRLVRFMDPEIDQDDVVLEVAAAPGWCPARSPAASGTSPRSTSRPRCSPRASGPPTTPAS